MLVIQKIDNMYKSVVVSMGDVLELCIMNYKKVTGVSKLEKQVAEKDNSIKILRNQLTVQNQKMSDLKAADKANKALVANLNAQLQSVSDYAAHLSVQWEQAQVEILRLENVAKSAVLQQEFTSNKLNHVVKNGGFSIVTLNRTPFVELKDNAVAWDVMYIENGMTKIAKIIRPSHEGKREITYLLKNVTSLDGISSKCLNNSIGEVC